MILIEFGIKNRHSPYITVYIIYQSIINNTVKIFKNQSKNQAIIKYFLGVTKAHRFI